MNPELDRQPRRTWPNPVDTPLDRARRIAGMYRARLRALDRAACDELDDTAAGFGEDWMLEKPEILDPERELTTSQAAELVNVHPDTIRKWACINHPKEPDTKLLPRAGWQGRERTYITAKILEAAVMAKTGQLAS